jgi:hypothetical protein
MLNWIWKRAPSPPGEPAQVLHPVVDFAVRGNPELSDSDLQDVVGGLDRIYVGGVEEEPTLAP